MAMATPRPVHPDTSSRISLYPGRFIFLFGLRFVSESNTMRLLWLSISEISSCLCRGKLLTFKTKVLVLL